MTPREERVLRDAEALIGEAGKDVATQGLAAAALQAVLVSGLSLTVMDALRPEMARVYAAHDVYVNPEPPIAERRNR